MTIYPSQTLTHSDESLVSTQPYASRKLSSQSSLSTVDSSTRLFSGLVGSLALTVVHESARRFLPSAPRLDVLGMRGIEKLTQALSLTPPTGQRLRTVALVGDILTNTVYYSCIPARGKTNSWVRALLLGGGAGIATQVLAPLLGLGKKPIAQSAATRVLTVAWYLAGGLATAWVAQQLQQRDSSSTSQR